MGTLYVVATPIGNLNDFSPRAVEILKSSDYILAEDTRQTIKLLNHFNIKKKMIAYHKFNEKSKVESIINDLKSGMNISLVSDAGTPCISDPGYILIKELKKENIQVIGIPGCSAVITSLSISGLDTSSFSFYGFVPTDNKPRKELYKEIKESKVKTKVLYESPKRLLKLLKELKEEIPGCAVCVCTELTKIHENTITGDISEVYDIIYSKKDRLKGEYVVLVSNEVENKIRKENISLEALIIDKIVREKVSIKEAINLVKEENSNISKKDIYNASLNLKEILKQGIN